MKRGYTLIELMIASVIALFIVAVTISLFLTQQRSFAALDLTRVSQDASRNALMTAPSTAGCRACRGR